MEKMPNQLSFNSIYRPSQSCPFSLRENVWSDNGYLFVVVVRLVPYFWVVWWVWGTSSREEVFCRLMEAHYYFFGHVTHFDCDSIWNLWETTDENEPAFAHWRHVVTEEHICRWSKLFKFTSKNIFYEINPPASLRGKILTMNFRYKFYC